MLAFEQSRTVDYLKSYFDEDVERHKIYRYLDRLHNTLQDKIQAISVKHTRRILGGRIGLVFPDFDNATPFLKLIL